MNSGRIVIVGGGAAGFFAALACVEAGCSDGIVIIEKGPQFLAKVKISGGGRCNVTHACLDAREFATHFPRGEQELIGPLQRFQAGDTVAWFAEHGVRLKTESDGRMFPVTDSSQTIIDCLLGAARAAGVKLILNCGVDGVARKPGGGFELTFSNGEKSTCDRLLLATGGCRTPGQGQLAVSLGHTLEPPVPSLFTFHIGTLWLRRLAGISVEPVEVSVPGTELCESGALLVTHSGLSGPAILRLSAWGARILHKKNYKFPVCVNWLPKLKAEKLAGGVAIAAQVAGGTAGGEFAHRATARAPLGAACSGVRCLSRDEMVGALAVRATQAHRAFVPHGIFRDRKKSESGGVCDMRRSSFE